VFCSNLKELRIKMDLTQKQIADSLKIDRSTYSYYESGKTCPPLDSLKRLAMIFSVSLDDLLEHNPTSTAQPASTFNSSRVEYQKNIPNDTSALTNQEKECIILFRQLGEKKKANVLHVMEKHLEEFKV